MDKEIKGYKDDSNEEKNTETNEKYYINWKYNSTIVSNIYWKNCI